MEEKEVIELIKEKLSIEVKTFDSYNGGLGTSGKMYTEMKEIKLLFDGIVISEAYL